MLQKVTDGGLKLLVSDAWPGKFIGDSTTLIPILGADYNLLHGFSAGVTARTTRFVHKNLFVAPVFPVRNRFRVAAAVLKLCCFGGYRLQCCTRPR
eukprot:1451729-Amphidinium_carterae.1